jgi:hypothetical protein
MVQLLEDRQIVDELEDREPRVQAEVLGQVAESPPDLDPVVGVGGSPAVDPDFAGTGGHQVARMRIRVVLPAPLGPSSPVIPGPSSSSRPARAATPP